MAVRKLKPEYQETILMQYKLCDLCSIIGDDKKFNEYVTTLDNYANAYRDASIALMELQKEISKEQECDPLYAISYAYDKLPEKEQREFCGKMLNKKNFFMIAYEIMMDILKSGVKTQKK